MGGANVRTVNQVPVPQLPLGLNPIRVNRSNQTRSDYIAQEETLQSRQSTFPAPEDIASLATTRHLCALGFLIQFLLRSLCRSSNFEPSFPAVSIFRLRLPTYSLRPTIDYRIRPSLRHLDPCYAIASSNTSTLDDNFSRATFTTYCPT